MDVLGIFLKVLKSIASQIKAQAAEKVHAGKNVTEIHGDVNVNIHYGPNSAQVPITPEEAQIITDKDVNVSDILDEVWDTIPPDLRVRLSEEFADKVKDENDKIPWLNPGDFEAIATSAATVMSTAGTIAPTGNATYRISTDGEEASIVAPVRPPSRKIPPPDDSSGETM